MGRILVPVTIVVAMAAFAVAALTAGFSPYQPGWWTAAVRLAVLGGIVPMIFAVTIRIVPVFSPRRWRSEARLRLQVAFALAGVWTTYVSQPPVQISAWYSAMGSPSPEESPSRSISRGSFASRWGRPRRCRFPGLVRPP
ncbi:MAG TPA: hypothetical protein VGR22_11270 [Thermomicrobiales bacterium]|nr:hypothetical protein [Thermomicrobiales bacterium]